MQTIDIGSLLYDYSISSDGTELRLKTDVGEVVFERIRTISIDPTSKASRLDGERREIDSVVWYKTADHIHSSREYYSTDDATATTIAVGPPALRAVYDCSDRKYLKSLNACFISADGIEATLIFERVTVEPNVDP